MRTTRTSHQPIRSCVVCRARAPKETLIRVAKVPTGFQLDLAQRLGGRGSWLCRACAEGQHAKPFARAFKQHTPSVLEQLNTQLPAALAAEMEA